ncbi:aminotransferase class III-fold pyridoxal phosphate-dependent enzyme [Mesonia sp.]|uniref:aspartate aminotransferase family protein n=1 Tax=Mesonia sp. TaxID=1960830 RepID=UPI0017743F25|nr:aminotransferase class III-fold pyridoxal phosphate-dependent enzyme [Mesonia sp.]HIB38187.1 aspartate aminotransferase family protein [Mesonia sp.]HIO26371.1 aspartate aminotransferase family protein [Flavobacteriaceae bacterium]
MNKDFLTYQAQTTPHPLGLEVSSAKGSYIYSTDGKAHLDFVAGVSACSLGHSHPKIVKAIKEQSEKYLHVMVYGEYAQSPAVNYTKLLSEKVDIPNAKTYLVNSGTEAIEGALKLARRYTGRQEIIAAHRAYHGNTMGSLSLMDFEERKKPFEPLLPEISFLNFNDETSLDTITNKTAAVILETIQGGAGFIQPKDDFLKKVKQRCEEVGALLILDEIQPGFGRTGKLFAYEHFGIIPDILVIGKGMAGGLPVGAFVASEKLMDSLSDNPKMGHITTFGGNPLIAASALATLKEITSTPLIDETLEKEKLFKTLLVHPLIEEVRGKGLMLAAIVFSEEIANQVILEAKDNELILFWLLFEKRAVRITPPLTISKEEIEKGCKIILTILDKIYKN